MTEKFFEMDVHTMDEVIKLENIEKHFGSVYANKDINLTIKRGDVHSIVGENGAGKSTLMNILYGMTRPDSGSIYYEGEKIEIKSPHDAIARGIGMVHQHFMLVPSFTVMENIVLGLPPKGEKIWRPESFRPEITKIMEDFGLEVDLDAKIQDISVGMKQRVEILKILYRGAKVIILDEPTATLTPQETKELFSTIRLLIKNDHTVIFISHKLREVMEISDKISALRDGVLVNTVNRDDVTAKDVAYMMIGRELEPLQRTSEDGEKEISLMITDLQAGNAGCVAIEDISFCLHKGEVVGVAGVEGNGQSTLVDAIVGAQEVKSGAVIFEGEDITGCSIEERMKKGLAHIPEDRMTEGLALPLSAEKNLILGIHNKEPVKKKGRLNWKEAERISEELIKSYSVKIKSRKEAVANLSGGNMQKIVVARELNRDPKIVVACQPTRGVDIGSSKYIRECLLNVKKEGGSVLLVSADLDEILELSDRIVVMYDGKISGVLDAGEATEERLGELMFGRG